MNALLESLRRVRLRSARALWLLRSRLMRQSFDLHERPTRRLLVIEGDRDAGARAEIVSALNLLFDCRWMPALNATDGAIAEGGADLLIVTASSPTSPVIRLLERWRERPSPIPVVAVLVADPDPSVLALVAAATDDFLCAPIRPSELQKRVERLCDRPRHDADAVRQRLLREMGLMQLVGQDPVFLRVLEQIPRFAEVDLPVLITGETGTGKELCARAIHHLGHRRPFPFVAADCGAVPEQLFENELFGHARGAFTDARADQKGLVAMSERGTLFLDEVDSLSHAAQAKLLRFLQEGTFRPLGSDRFQQANVRVVAATNRDVEACVKEKQMRSDLYYRLNVLRLHLPPLRDRRSDIELLAHHILRQSCSSTPTRAREFSSGALRLLTGYHWPGNVRELTNVIQRAALVCDAERILPAHLTPLQDSTADPQPLWGSFRTERALAVAAFERRYVEELLKKHGGNVTHAAREAQQDRRAFGRFIKKYNINRRRLGA
jgi:two-component system response regulator AtoC